MAHYRIKVVAENNRLKYIPQYKNFLFWHSWKSYYLKTETGYDDESAAKEFIENHIKDLQLNDDLIEATKLFNKVNKTKYIYF